MMNFRKGCVTKNSFNAAVLLVTPTWNRRAWRSFALHDRKSQPNAAHSPP
jgi:hypothetical protein